MFFENLLKQYDFSSLYCLPNGYKWAQYFWFEQNLEVSQLPTLKISLDYFAKVVGLAHYSTIGVEVQKDYKSNKG